MGGVRGVDVQRLYERAGGAGVQSSTCVFGGARTAVYECARGVYALQPMWVCKGECVHCNVWVCT